MYGKSVYTILGVMKFMILDIMKCLYDKTRLRILSILFYKNGPMCVGQVEGSLRLSQPNASRHLKRLLNDGFVIMSKKTQFVYYELNPKILKEYDFLICLLKKNTEEMKECTEDIKRLKDMQRVEDFKKNINDKVTSKVD